MTDAPLTATALTATTLTATIPADRHANTLSPLLPSLAARWSPRAYDPTAVIDEATLTTVLEAARWAPSASNMQPSRFIVARRGSASFATINDALMGFNRAWADTASVLIVSVAKLSIDETRENPWARYDLGQAVAHLTIQAQHDGLHTHQMGGFDGPAIAAAFNLTEDQAVVTVTALGVLGKLDDLTPELREREVAPRTRKPLTELLLVND
ncbi:MAG: nitroreductase family protein [Cryobacterium sp.]|uniref:nitroreductase family protein n=1 Tax=unclassified Cryobacterium TaxID=2649013 RepID=UPI0018C8F966|nr:MULTISPECIES: nitroreductase family protein [unclassified Cryobacterium]MCY7404627.1 nitroreductase family protein [Cryobacterium sp.]MEC5153829.1 nitroreductase [Cryobacterium sp. CAN_C3]